jgi:S1-C subfamily serine protease
MMKAGSAQVAVAVLVSILCGALHAAETPKDVVGAVVKVDSKVPPGARTAGSLGTERQGSGVVIDSKGLILTIGYLVLEAITTEVTPRGGKPVSAKFVGYDHDTGFGLLRATSPLGVAPMKLGQSSPVGERDEVLVASHGGSGSVQGAFVVSRREFAGSWEYLLEKAIFTAPPHAAFGGAALIGRDGKLLGIGSLFVQDAVPGYGPVPGNMFVPIDLLNPILADLIARGRPAGPRRPWLGVRSEEFRGRVVVVRVTPGGPADQAGIRPGDVVVGVAGRAVSGLADFYRKVWASGDAGVGVPLNVLQGVQVQEVTVQSADRRHYLRLNPTY